MHKNMVYAALVGDVIASRHSGDRERLQTKMQEALMAVNASVSAVQGLAMTIGDEFQGLYAQLGEAVSASLMIRLQLAGAADTRIGIGWGGLEVVTDTPPFGQDGPCWWRAREAIESVEEAESSNAVPRTIRTFVRTDDEREPVLNSYLVLRDHVMAAWDETDALIARRLLDGESQSVVAEEVGLSQSSISRRAQRHGILSVLDFQPDVPR